MEEATGAPSSFAVSVPKRLRASGRDGETVMTEPPSPLRMLLSRHTKRREFITLLLGGVAAWPLGAWAQDSAKLPTIGFLGANTAASQSQWTAAFVQRLGELGWGDGRNIAIVYRWADGRADRSAEIAAEFIQLKVDVIATSGTPMALAAKRATSTIPIVFATAGDPVGTGLIASLARPGGNVTGLSMQQIDLGSKRIELFRELVPQLRRLAVMANVRSPDAVRQLQDVKTTVDALGLEFVKCEIPRIEDVASVIDGLKSRAEALYVISDPLLFSYRDRVNALAMSIRLPTIHSFRDHVETGGLMSYGPNYQSMFRRAADFVDKILRGTKPGDIPVEQPTQFELVINLKTAKVLGIEIPPTLLARADEVIE
jgi:putative ABC transport system substrate-binding protein